MRPISVALIAALVVPAATAADSIQVRAQQVGPDRYELQMELPASVAPQQASTMLLPAAEQLCAGRPAQLGRYRFEAKAPLLSEAGATAMQTFMQQVECGPSTEVVHVSHAPKAPPTPQDEQAIRDDTLRYLAAKDRGDFDTAYALLGSKLAAMFAEGQTQAARTQFNAAAGQPSHRDVVRVTWYDDPAGAPQPGRYAAADYRGDYPNTSFYCGYVLWHLQADGRFRIIREEEAQMLDEIAKAFSPEQLAAARAQLQCRD